MEPEDLPLVGAEDATEDELDLGSHLMPETITIFGRSVRSDRARAALWRAGALVAAAVLAAGLLHAITQGPTNGLPIATTSSVSSSGTNVSNLPGTLSPFDRVLALAHAAKLTNEMRQTSPPGSCALVRVGHPPEPAIMRVVHDLVGGTTTTEAARTLDQFTGLCAVELRAHTRAGATVVVQISAPPPHPKHNTLDAVEVGIETDGDVTTTYALEARHDGWIILIGATGKASALPGSSELTAAVATPTMIW